MIISASRRTDIPAFFGEWFIKRIKAGFFVRVNPFNRGQVKRISLAPADIDALVFWTKNPRPFLPCLDELDQRGYPYYFLYTLNDYPQIFEPGLPPLPERIKAFQYLSGRLGPGRVIWRYDPVIISSLTPLEYHHEKFTRLGRLLQGQTSRVIISFVEYYGKVLKRLAALTESRAVVFQDVRQPESREVMTGAASELTRLASDLGLTMFSCAERIDLRSCGLEPSSCIDPYLINNLIKTAKSFPRDKHQRPHCRCAQSVDMGMYDTCRHGCVYCYANNNQLAIERNLKRYRPDGISLIPV